MDAYQFSEVLPASCIAYSPGSTFIATAVRQQLSVRLTRTLDCVRSWACDFPADSKLQIDTALIDRLKWSPDGSQVCALASRAGWVWVFDLSSDKLVARIGGEVTAIEWGADVLVTHLERVGQLLSLVDVKGIATYDLSSGQHRFIQGVQGGCAWSPDLRYMAVSERHHGKEYIGVYDREQMLRHFEVCTTESTGLSWSPCGKWISVLDWALSYLVHFYSPVGAHLGSYTPSRSSTSGLESAQSISQTAWSPSGRHIAIGDSGGTVHILESETWTCVAILSGPAPSVLVEPPKHMLASESIVQFVNGTASISESKVYHLGFSSDGSLLFFSQDSTLNVYSFLIQPSTASPSLTQGMTVSFNDSIRSVERCPTTNRIGIATRSGFLYLLDAHGVEGVRVSSDGSFAVNHLSWSPDGRAIAVSDKASVAVVYEDIQDPNTGTWEEE